MAKQVIAVIGSGGKTTAMGVLAKQCAEQSVLLTTTTHIFPMESDVCDACLVDPDPELLVAALEVSGIVCAGTATSQGKLTALLPEVLTPAKDAADVVLYEADGSRSLPLKLHRPDEPVLLPETTSVLMVAGLSALGKPIQEAVHRWELEPVWQNQPTQLVEGEAFLRCVLETADSAGVPYAHIRVFLNQADDCADVALAEIVAAQLRSRGLQTRIGSLRENPDGLYAWVIAE